MTPNEQTAEQTILNSIETVEYGTELDGSPRRVLQVIYGPYTGVKFTFGKFEIDESKMVDGMYSAVYETTVYTRPEGFRPDEAWDQWTSELLQAILYEHIGRDVPQVPIAKESMGVH